jgi:5-methylcytosine-specific restriction endonuclease McrA
MPIKAENRARYPKDWPAISMRIRQRANHCCEFCGVPDKQLGGRSPVGAWHPAVPLGERLTRLEWPAEGSVSPCAGYDQPLRIVRIVLTVAHMDHTPENCTDENLKALCQRCHNRYDAPHRRKNAAATVRSKKALGDLFNQSI